MTEAYRPEAWHELYVMLGGAIAALTGLLFVATSLHVEKIAQTPHWAKRAFTNTFALIGVLIECILILSPQPPLWLGVELIALNLFLLAFLMLPLICSWLKNVPGLPPIRLFFGTIAWVIGALGGLGLITHAGGGMLLVTSSCAMLIWVCMWNAWSLLVARFHG
jgi:modulator of FtsH protease